MLTWIGISARSVSGQDFMINVKPLPFIMESKPRHIDRRVFALGSNERFRTCEHNGVTLFFDGYAALDFDKSGQFQYTLPEDLVESYRKNGVNFLTKLRGSFTIALWDAAKQKLVLAVDPFGTRSLYYRTQGDLIAFAPRIRAFRENEEIKRDIDPNVLYFYLNHSFIPAPYTIFREIKRLEPGHYLVWHDGKSVVQPYWDIPYAENHTDEQSLCEILRAAMEESIRFHLGPLESKLPFGAFLSGGIDSSTVVGLMAKICGSPVKSFSVGFDEEPYNELFYARIAAARFQSKSHECFVKPDEALAIVPRLGAEFDEPFGNSSAIPTFFCLDMARQSGVKLMFAGDGGDELFGGNERYASERIFAFYQNIPFPFRKCVEFIAPSLPPRYPWKKISNYVRKANQSVPERFYSYQLFMRDNYEEYFTDDFQDSLQREFAIEIPCGHYCRSGNVSPLNRLLYMDLKMAIGDNDLFKVNRMAEALGVEVRYPFLDKNLATVSGTIPADLKVKGSEKRYLFKKAFRTLLPKEILSKKKHGFGLPTGDWLRSHRAFREFARSVVLDSRSLARGYFKTKAVEQLFVLHDREASNYYGSHIWNFLMLELWHRNHVDG